MTVPALKEDTATTQGKSRVIGQCQKCGGEYQTYPSHAARRKYCSRSCRSQGKITNWKGGLTIIAGRPCIYKPDHPRAMKGMGYVYETILIAEKALGRPLVFYRLGDPRNEVTHHLNKNPADNRTENLVICTEQYHQWLHQVRMKTREEGKQKGQLLAVGRWKNHDVTSRSRR